MVFDQIITDCSVFDRFCFRCIVCLIHSFYGLLVNINCGNDIVQQALCEDNYESCLESTKVNDLSIIILTHLTKFR
jgi:hypothetical protein